MEELLIRLEKHLDELLKENMDNIVATEYPYLITSNLVPVYKEDSDIMMEKICKIGRTTKEKEEIKRAFLKDNYYEEYSSERIGIQR